MNLNFLNYVELLNDLERQGINTKTVCFWTPKSPDAIP